MPIMTYGCEVWDIGIDRELTELHMNFLKHLLCVHKNTRTDIVYGEQGECPINITINARMIGYWLRLLTVKLTN